MSDPTGQVPIEAEFSPSDYLADIDALRTMIEKGRTVMFSPDVRVDREQALSLIAQLRAAIPIAIGRADEVLEKAEAELATARKQAAQQRDQAEADATRLRAEAKAEGEALVARAKAEADKTRDAAKTEADAMLETARARAAELVGQEAVLAQATTQAADIVAEAQATADQLRSGAEAYCEERLSQLAAELSRFASLLGALDAQVEAGRRRLQRRSAHD